jgi:hypothetical protein
MSAYEGAYLAPTRYLRFEQIHRPKRVTMTWAVVSQSSSVKLGEIRWHSPWRQYVFFPSSETLFNIECMVTICDRIQTLMRWRRNVKANLERAAS